MSSSNPPDLRPPIDLRRLEEAITETIRGLIRQDEVYAAAGWDEAHKVLADYGKACATQGLKAAQPALKLLLHTARTYPQVGEEVRLRIGMERLEELSGEKTA